MKKRWILMMICATVWAVSAGTTSSESSAAAPESGRQITVHTPSLSTIQCCFGAIRDAVTELAADFSIEQTTAADSAGDVYTIYVG